jgi:sec-independent protein translocase protein TatB
MNILGMGPMEILLIVVLALIVFGPAKLPEIMGQVGKAIADFRRATSELSDEFNRTIQAELKETRAVVDDTKSAVTGVHTSINAALTSAPAPVRTAAPGEALAAPNGTAAEPVANNGTANGTGPDTATPPLADTSQWSWETAAPAPPKPAAEVSTIESVAAPPLAAEPAGASLETATAPRAEPQPAAAEPSTPPARARKTTRDDLVPPY